MTPILTIFDPFKYSRTFKKKNLKVENLAKKTTTEFKNFLARFSTVKNSLKIFEVTKMAQNLSGSLIRPTLQSEKKYMGSEKIGHSLFSTPSNQTFVFLEVKA